MSENTPTQTDQPDPDLAALNRLVGTWQVSGGANGTVTYEWLTGGFFLLQHIGLEHDGHQITGLEVIGHERPFEGQSSADIKSRVYDSDGNTLDYVYEIDGDTLTIWGGERGSPAYYRGTFAADANSLSGEWVWPGGGYPATLTKLGTG